jgi:hypothetical protein
VETNLGDQSQVLYCGSASVRRLRECRKAEAGDSQQARKSFRHFNAMNRTDDAERG